MDEDTGLVRASLAYPFGGEGTGTRLLFGAGLNLLGGVVAVGVAAAATEVALAGPATPVVAAVVALLAYVPLLGYLAATIRALLDDEPAPPGVDRWGGLLQDGLRFAGVGVLYGVPAAALAVAATAVEGAAVAAALWVAAGVCALGAAYVLPAVAVTVVESGVASAAWDGGRLRDAVVDRRYAGRWLLAVAVAAVGGLLGAPLSIVVVGLPVLFVAQLAAVYAVTRGVVLALDLTLEDPPPAPASGYVPGWEDGADRKELSQGRLGGSLLPTTPDGGDGDTDVAVDDGAGTSGPLASTGDGGGGATDLDRPSASAPGVTQGAGGAGGESDDGDDGQEDIEPYEDAGSDLDTRDDS